MIGDVALSPDLYAVLVDEADVHLATLAHELSVLQFDPSAWPSPQMVRAGHTLCGIHRTSGLSLIALTAKALEECLLALQQAARPMPETALPILAAAIQGLGEFVGRVKSRTGFNALDSARAADIQQDLETLSRAVPAEPAGVDAEAEAEREFESVAEAGAVLDVHPIDVAAAEMVTPEPAIAPELAAAPERRPSRGKRKNRGRRAAAHAGVTRRKRCRSAEAEVETEPVAVAPIAAEAPTPAPEAAHAWRSSSPRPNPPDDALADIRDDVDEQVLPIFLEEAAELYPQAGEQLRGLAPCPRRRGDARGICAGRCTRSRAARGWPARCAWASSRI